MAFGRPITVRALVPQALVTATRMVPQGEAVTVTHTPWLVRRIAAGEFAIVTPEAPKPAAVKKEA